MAHRIFITLIIISVLFTAWPLLVATGIGLFIAIDLLLRQFADPVVLGIMGAGFVVCMLLTMADQKAEAAGRKPMGTYIIIVALALIASGVFLWGFIL